MSKRSRAYRFRACSRSFSVSVGRGLSDCWRARRRAVDRAGGFNLSVALVLFVRLLIRPAFARLRSRRFDGRRRWSGTGTTRGRRSIARQIDYCRHCWSVVRCVRCFTDRRHRRSSVTENAVTIAAWHTSITGGPKTHHWPATMNFWATVCKTVRPMLSGRCLSSLSVSLSVCLSVCDGGVLW